MSEVRLLTAEDSPALETFLAAHWTSSMFLRSNVRQTPIGAMGRFAGKYAAKFDGARIIDVAAHYKSFGNIILLAPTDVAAVAEACVLEASPINGVLGPWDQVEAGVDILGLRERRALMDKPEILYALRLADLQLPAILAEGAVRCRRSVLSDIEMLAKWRTEYSVETLSAPGGTETARRARDEVAHGIEDGTIFVLESDGPVAMALYNAQIPAVVQIGGVWTPPELRGRGFGRAVTAGALSAARDTGTENGVLFTPITNLAAQRAYESIGFKAVGRYGVLLYAAE
tara:strand:+ start:1831 stop:2688 length:858 start_codon:yes stop_codon:yes gene_type:complete